MPLSNTVKYKIGVKGWNFQGEMQKKWRKTEKTTKGKGKAMLNFVNIAFLRGNKSRHVRKSMRKIMCRKQSHYVLWVNAETITPFIVVKTMHFWYERLCDSYMSVSAKKFRGQVIRWSPCVSFLYMYFMFIHSFYLSLLIPPKIYQFRPLDVCTLESTLMTLCVVAASISTEAYCFLIWRGSKE